MIYYEEGNRYWCNDNYELHREDGPAVEYVNGDRSWYRDGKPHREDGPAIDWVSNGLQEWWFNGQQFNVNSQEEFERILKIKAFW